MLRKESFSLFLNNSTLFSPTHTELFLSFHFPEGKKGEEKPQVFREKVGKNFPSSFAAISIFYFFIKMRSRTHVTSPKLFISSEKTTNFNLKS